MIIHTRKPNPQTAMQNLILQVRADFPFNESEANICAGACQGCPKKLIEIADTELSDWEVKLANNEQPKLGDISRLAKLCKNIRRGLKRNNLVQ